MADEQRQETGGSLMVIGWLLAFFALIVMFYHPGYVGRTGVALIAGALFVAGLIVNMVGYRIRVKAR